MSRAANLKKQEEARKARITAQEILDMRDRVEKRLEEFHHYGIRLRKSRATLGKLFEHARKAETLVSYRMGDPIYLPLYRIVEIMDDDRLLKRNTEYIFQVLTREALRYLTVRPPVRHRVWRDPEASKNPNSKKEPRAARTRTVAHAHAVA